MDTGIGLIERERMRQVFGEGWTPEHDDQHADGQMAIAAACYAIAPYQGELEQGVSENYIVCTPDGMDAWPWADEWDKRDQHDHKRCLVIAGALIAAELDRLLRLEEGARVARRR